VQVSNWQSPRSRPKWTITFISKDIRKENINVDELQNWEVFVWALFFHSLDSRDSQRSSLTEANRERASRRAICLGNVVTLARESIHLDTKSQVSTNVFHSRERNRRGVANDGEKFEFSLKSCSRDQRRRKERRPTLSLIVQFSQPKPKANEAQDMRKESTRETKTYKFCRR
jgi:hypothetical protein